MFRLTETKIIAVFVKWEYLPKQFKILTDYLDREKIKYIVHFGEGRSYIKVTGTEKQLHYFYEDYYNVICSGGGETYTFVDMPVDLTKPICVTDLTRLPIKIYYAKLLPNYLKETLESAKFFLNKEVYGFIKFNKNKPLESEDFIVSNMLHQQCEILNLNRNCHEYECCCYQGEEQAK